MSLESSAKTPEEIMRSAKMPHGFKEKWIPLKESQKEISALKKEFEKNNAFTHNKILELSAKIGDANKIFAVIDKELKDSPQPQDMNVCFSVLLYSQLKSSLSQEQTRGEVTNNK